MQSVLTPRHTGVSVLPAALTQLSWFAGGAAIGFSVPFVFTSLLDLNNDLYYAIYFSIASGFLALYSAETHLDLRALFGRQWKWSVGLGLAATAFLVWSVLSRETTTPHPGEPYFAFSIAWRGLVYGTVDALLLSAFPMAVAFAVFNRKLDSVIRKLGYGALSMALVLTITAAYHLGYQQFRDDGLAAPETGNTVISLPAVLTTNPLGSLIAHAGMHITADIHAYETDTYLPPQTFVNDGPSDLPTEVQVTNGDTGHAIFLANGGSLIIALVSNPSTGYHWVVDGTLPEQLEQQGDPRFAPAGSTSPVVDAPGTEVFTFTAIQTGTPTLKLAYVRTGEPGPARTFSVVVGVR